VFGPITVVWFISLAVLGVVNILHEPEVLHAINPIWAARFFIDYQWHGIFILGAVVLAVTGGEAIYTDMGHFGARPIRLAWYWFVLPSLMLNYLGQGALVLENPLAVKNPFYIGVPEWGRYPMIVLATAATVIASQAVITGGFSVARQAMQLGYIPRMHVKHTSSDTEGQIYIPGINWLMMVIVISLVLSFRSSSALATAYGISVSATMLIDTLLLAIVAHALWPRARRWVLPLCVVFLIGDVAFVIANGAKIPQGGWFPVVLGIALFTLLRTWRRGRELLSAEIRKEGIQLDTFLPGLMLAPPVRVQGTAVFLTAQTGVVPHAMLHNLKHNKVLHERNVFLTVETLTVPYSHKRLRIDEIGEGFYRVVLRFGFMETPDVPLGLRQWRHLLRSDGHHLFRQPRNRGGFGAARHADLARQAVRADAPQCRLGDGLLPDSRQSSGRAGFAGRDLRLGTSIPHSPFPALPHVSPAKRSTVAARPVTSSVSPGSTMVSALA
jgi:KUP system potassium uptake protein